MRKNLIMSKMYSNDNAGIYIESQVRLIYINQMF